MNQDDMTPQVKPWDLPFVEDTKASTQKTNALNKKPEWKYEPPEPEPEIVLPTAEDIEAIRQAAYEEGFEQGKQEGFEQGQTEGFEEGQTKGLESGHEEGFEKGLSEGQQQIDDEVNAWQAINQQFVDPLSQLDDQVEKEVIQLAVGLARAVINAELAINPDIIQSALRAGLKALPIQENRYQVYLNPNDLDIVKKQLSDENLNPERWQLQESPELARGGCEIVTQNNAVDVTLERRIKDVLDRFLFEHGLPKGD